MNNLIEKYGVNDNYFLECLGALYNKVEYPEIFDFIIKTAHSDNHRFKNLFSHGLYHNLKAFPDTKQGLSFFINVHRYYDYFKEDINIISMNLIQATLLSENELEGEPDFHCGDFYALTHYDTYSNEYIKRLLTFSLSKDNHRFFAKGRPRSWRISYKPVESLLALKLIADSTDYKYLFKKGVITMYD